MSLEHLLPRNISKNTFKKQHFCAIFRLPMENTGVLLLFYGTTYKSGLRMLTFSIYARARRLAYNFKEKKGWRSSKFEGGRLPAKRRPPATTASPSWRLRSWRGFRSWKQTHVHVFASISLWPLQRLSLMTAITTTTICSGSDFCSTKSANRTSSSSDPNWRILESDLISYR